MKKKLVDTFRGRKRVVAIAASIVITLTCMSITSIAFQGQRAYAHTVIDQIPVPAGPLQMSLANNTLFVASVGQPIVSVIDTTTGNTVNTINATRGVSTVYAAPQLDKLYVSVFDTPIVRVYNLTTLNFIKNIELPGAVLDYWMFPGNNVSPHILATTGGSSMDYDPTTGMMYVTIYNHDHMEVIDTSNDTAVKTINLPAHPSAVKVDPQAQLVLVTSTAGNRLSFISTKTNSIVGDMVTGNAPWDLAVDTSTHTAYVTHLGSFYIASVDIPTRSINAKIPTTDEAAAIAVDSSEHKVYFSTVDGKNIVKVDGKTNQVDTVIGVDSTPSYLLADSQTHNVYASVNQGNKVVVIGPHFVSVALPVVTVDNPQAVVGTIQAHGQDVLPEQASLSVSNKTLTLFVESQDGGNLTLLVPRQIMDAQQGVSDGKFQITIDGKSIPYQEGPVVSASDGSQSRQISIQVPKGASSVQMSGTQVVPEFGSLSAIVLGIALVSVIAYAGRAIRTRNSPMN